MKNYSTKAFYNYARKLVEGDAAAGTDINAEFERVNSGQFKKMVAGAAVGIVGALACLKYLDRYFSVANLSNIVQKYYGYANIAANDKLPFFTRFGAALKNSIREAARWILNLCGRILKHASWLKKPIISGTDGSIATSASQFNPTYGSVLCMALVGSAIGAVIYKVYKVVKDRRATTESAVEYRTRQAKRVRKALKESDAMFAELTALTESNADAIRDAIRFGDPNMIDMGTVDPEAVRGMTFIEKMNAKISEMWAGVKNIATQYPVLTVMIGLCAATVACWYGVKKYKDHKAATTAAAESIRPAKKTRRMVRKSAYSF